MSPADFESAYRALMDAGRYAEAHVFLCARSGLDPETTYSKARMLARHPGLAQRRTDVAEVVRAADRRPTSPGDRS